MLFLTVALTKVTAAWRAGTAAANERAPLRTMKAKLIKDCGLAATLFVAGFSLCGAAEKAVPPPREKAAEKAIPLPADSRVEQRAPAKGRPTPANASPEVQKFSDRRDTLLEARETLEQQLKTATEAQRQEILKKMEDQKKELLETQRAIARQIKEDARKRLTPSSALKK